MVTIHPTNQPDNKHSAHSLEYFEVSSDRLDSGSLLSASAQNSGGVYVLTTTAHGYTANDVILGSGFVDDNLNTRLKVIAVTSTTITTNITFVANDFGVGKVIRDNANFRIRADLYRFNSAIGSIVSVADAGGGLVELAYSVAHGYTTDDIIMVFGTSFYNGVFKITVTSTTTLTIVHAFNTTELGNTMLGTLTTQKRVDNIIQGSSDVFIISLNNIIRTYLGYDFATLGTSGLIESSQSFIYGVNFIEEWDNELGVFTEYDNTISDSKIAYDVAKQRSETQSITTNVLNNSTRLFLTDFDYPEMGYTDEFHLHFITPTIDNYKLAYQTYNLDGSPNSVQYTTLTAINYIGVAKITSTLFTTAHNKLDVWIVESTNTQLSEKKTITLKAYSCDYTRVAWQNKRGGFDFLNILGNLGQTNRIKKYGYEKPLSYNYSSSDFETNVVHSERENIKAFESELVTATYYDLLVGLYESKTVFEIGTTQLPIIVSNQLKEFDTLNLKTAEINYTYSQKLI